MTATPKIYQLDYHDENETYYAMMVSTKVSDIESAIREIESPTTYDKYCTIDVWENGCCLKTITIPFWMN